MKNRIKYLTDYESTNLWYLMIALIKKIGAPLFFWGALIFLLAVFTMSFGSEYLQGIYGTSLMGIHIAAQINIAIAILGILVAYFGQRKTNSWLIIMASCFVGMVSFIYKLAYTPMDQNELAIIITMIIILAIGTYCPLLRSVENEYK